MAYCCLILLGKSIQKVVFGELRISEQQVGLVLNNNPVIQCACSSLDFLCFAASEGQVLELCVLQVHLRVRRGQRAVHARGK